MNKSKLLVAPLLVVPLMASCGGSTEYKVSIPDTKGVSVYPGQAIKGKDYIGTIEIATDMIDKQVLPETLDKVTSGNKELVATKDYTYTLKEDKLTADFKVPAANIVGDVAIQLTLVDKPVPVTQYTLTFTGDDFNELYLDSEYKTKFVNGTIYDKGASFNGYFKANEAFIYPTSDKVVLKSNNELYSNYNYNPEDGHISFTVNSNIDIFETERWYEQEEWWNYCSCEDDLMSANAGDIGKEVKVTLDDGYDPIEHTVRLIDVDHKGTPHIQGSEDKVEAHCTFEFKNLITVYQRIKINGNTPYTTKWGDTDNYNFPASALDTFLNGTEESNDDSVLQLLPDDLQSKIQTVTKEVAISNDSGSTYEIATYPTKLFPLSYREITATGDSTDQKNEGSTYAFYTEDGDTDNNRTKTIVGSEYKENYWIRSPLTSTNDKAWCANGDGITNNGIVDPIAVAPAFCI